MENIIQPDLEQHAVPVRSVRLYPGNARRGDVAAIAESLAVNGQYRPIVVQRSTSRVLVGNHTLSAARKLGWKKIAAVFVDVDDTEAARIVVSDNRTRDLGDYDPGVLADMLGTLPGLDGTGYGEDEVALLAATLEQRHAFDGTSRTVTEIVGNRGYAKVRVGRLIQKVATGVWDPWWTAFTAAHPTRQDQIAELRRRLGLFTCPARRQAHRRTQSIGPAAERIMLADMQVPIDSITPSTRNARRGDVAAIAESLAVNGQYRPIVVQRSTREILAGNHTYTAARALDWKHIAVTWVDVDEQTATRIILADNRTGELGGYNDAELAALLNKIGSPEGTGFGDDDWAAILDGYGYGASVPAPPPAPSVDGRAVAAVGPCQFLVTADEYLEWEASLETADGAPAHSLSERRDAVLRRLQLGESS